MKKNEKISIPCEELDTSLEQLVREFYENNITNVEDKIYGICMNKLRKIIKNLHYMKVQKIRTKPEGFSGRHLNGKILILI